MGNVAPHECNEVRLVAAGTKPLAAIEKAKQPIMYAMAISLANAGVFKMCMVDLGEVLISKSSKRILEYQWLLQNGVKAYGIKEYHRRMGRLFGYLETDIEAFIDAEIKCNCTKCIGATSE